MSSFKKRLRASTIAGVILASIAAATAMGAAAQDTPQTATPAPAQDEVVVTVTAYKQGALAVQKVPGSIAVLGQARLEAMGVANFSDFARSVAGLTFADYGPGDKRYIIRGINSAGEAQVATYYDNVPMSGMGGAATSFGGQQADLDLYDVQQIEVLRGPQGTLYGSNSQSGVIRFVTNKPRLDRYAASLLLDGSQTTDGGGNYAIKGMVNVPLVEDKLALRVVAYHDDFSGFIDNTYRNKDNYNFYRDSGVRIGLKGQLGDRTSMLLQYFYHSMDSGGQPQERNVAVTDADTGVFYPAAGDRKNDLYSWEPRTDTTKILALTLEHQFDKADLTVATSYTDRNAVMTEDDHASFNFFHFLQGVGAFPDTLDIPAAGVSVQPQSTKLFNTEARISTHFDGPINGVFGVYYSDRTIDFATYLYASVPATGRPDYAGPVLSNRFFSDKTKDSAIFGEATWKITQKLAFTGGVRVFKTDRSIYSNTVVPFFGLGVPTETTTKADADGTIYKANLSYNLTPDILVFTQYAEGYRGGGTNASSSTDVPAGYGPDRTRNYEAGIKSSLFGGKVLANLTAYSIDLIDLQIEQRYGVGGVFSGVGNLSGTAARSQGGEFDITARPIQGMTLIIAAGLSDAKLTKDLPALGALALEGTPLLNVPKSTYSVSLDQRFTLGGKSVSVGGDLQHVDGIKYTTYDEYNVPTSAYTLVNLRATLNLDRYSLTLYADNAFDENAQVNIENTVNDPYNVLTNRPRTIGLRLNAHW
jgi:iron complex outermembrane receptor protein